MLNNCRNVHWLQRRNIMTMSQLAVYLMIFLNQNQFQLLQENQGIINTYINHNFDLIFFVIDAFSNYIYLLIKIRPPVSRAKPAATPAPPVSGIFI